MCTGSQSVGREQVRSRKCMGREKVSREKTNTLVVNRCKRSLIFYRQSIEYGQSIELWTYKSIDLQTCRTKTCEFS